MKAKDLKAEEVGEFDIFVSHSHGDQEAVKLVIKQWEEWGYEVFADFRDKRLVKASKKGLMTAELSEYLRTAIQKCVIFVFVASPKSALSGWMPWELGLAHGSVGRVHIYLLDPTAMQTFSGREYLQLYRRTTFSAESAQKYLKKALALARSELNNPASIEAALRMGQAIARGGTAAAFREGRAALEQGATTLQGVSKEGPASATSARPSAGPQWNPLDPLGLWSFWGGTRR